MELEISAGGVRNGPPYPLDKKTSRRVKSGKQDKELKKYSRAKSGRTQYYKISDRDWYTLQKFDRDDEAVRINPKDYLTPETMSSIKTLGNKGKISGGVFGDVYRANPLRENTRDDSIIRGSSNNCVKCTSALALRALGYDVVAGLSANGMENNATQHYWDGARPYKEKGAKNLEQRMMSFGQRGMGELIMRYRNGSGHSVYFQNERQPNGDLTPIVYDGQTGRVYTSVQKFIDNLGLDSDQFGQITRLDDAAPNLQAMQEDSVFVPRKGRYGFMGRDDTRHAVYDI